jgi:hypothetical protein
MPRSVVGLLVAVGATVSVLAALVHGDALLAIASAAGVATGLGAYLSLPSKKTRLGNKDAYLLPNVTTACIATLSDGFCQGWA